MRGKHYTEEQIIAVLKEWELGMVIGEVASRKHGRGMAE